MAENPEPIDIHVGSRVRLRRNLMGLSQQKLGDAVGLTFQQIQKYEKGTNRIGSSRLFQFSQVLDVPVSFFFDDIPAEFLTMDGVSDTAQEGYQSEDNLARRETLELVRAYYKIGDEKVRKRIFEMVKAVGGSYVGNLDEEQG